MAPHILVIDDQVNLPRFIAMELHAEGYQVSVNCNDLAISSLLRELNPDLVIVNWELRQASAFDICRQLRLVDQQVPIVIITTKDESSCCPAFELGVQTCLTKPFSMDALLATIEYYLHWENHCMEHPVCT